MNVVTMTEWRHWTCGVLAAGFLVAAAPAFAQVDGSGVVITQEVGEFLNSVGDMYRSSEFADLELPARERLILTKAQLRLISSDKAAGLLYKLSQEHMMRRDIDEARRVAKLAVERAPEDSYIKARALFLVGFLNSDSSEYQISCYEKAVEIAEKLEARSAQWSAADRQAVYKTHAAALRRLAMEYGLEGHHEKRIACYVTIVSSPDLLNGCSPVAKYMVYQSLLIHAEESGDREFAEKVVDRVEKFVASGECPDDSRCYMLIRLIRGRFAFGDAKRIAALQKLWSTPEFAKDNFQLDVGCELLLSYVLGGEKYRLEFVKFVPELESRIADLRGQNRSLSELASDEDYVRLRLLTVHFCSEYPNFGGRLKVREVQQELKKMGDRLPVQNSAPGYLTAAQAGDVVEILERARERVIGAEARPAALRQSP